MSSGGMCAGNAVFSQTEVVSESKIVREMLCFTIETPARGCASRGCETAYAAMLAYYKDVKCPMWEYMWDHVRTFFIMWDNVTKFEKIKAYEVEAPFFLDRSCEDALDLRRKVVAFAQSTGISDLAEEGGDVWVKKMKKAALGQTKFPLPLQEAVRFYRFFQPTGGEGLYRQICGQLWVLGEQVLAPLLQRPGSLWTPRWAMASGRLHIPQLPLHMELHRLNGGHLSPAWGAPSFFVMFALGAYVTPSHGRGTLARAEWCSPGQGGALKAKLSPGARNGAGLLGGHCCRVEGACNHDSVRAGGWPHAMLGGKGRVPKRPT